MHFQSLLNIEHVSIPRADGKITYVPALHSEHIKRLFFLPKSLEMQAAYKIAFALKNKYCATESA